jgi:hypothetical protein
MRNYLLFYTIFTATVVGAAVYYCDKQAVKATEKSESVAHILAAQKIMLGQMRNDMYTIDEGIKNNPNKSYFKTTVLRFWEQYDALLDSTDALLQRKIFKKEEGYNTISVKTHFTDSDIQQYKAWRNTFKKYWQDSVLKDTALLRIGAKADFDPQQEADIQAFFENYKQFYPAEQHNWLTADKIHLLALVQNNMSVVANHLSATLFQTQMFNLNFSAFIRNKHPTCSPKEVFEATILVAPITKTDSLLTFKIDGKPLKSKNGRAYFDLPVGKVSDKSKKLNTSAQLYNPATGQKIIMKEQIEYKVSP